MKDEDEGITFRLIWEPRWLQIKSQVNMRMRYSEARISLTSHYIFTLVPTAHGRVVVLYLCHVDGAHRQRLVAQDGSVLVPLPPLQHDLQLVPFPFQEVGILRKKNQEKRKEIKEMKLKSQVCDLLGFL